MTDDRSAAGGWGLETATEELQRSSTPVWDPRTGEWIEPLAERKRPGVQKATIRAALAGGIVGAVVAAAIAFPVARMTSSSTTAVQRVESLPAAQSKDATLVEKIASRARPWVVNVDVRGDQATLFGNVAVTGTGSGVILRSDGYIITNAHVVADARSIEVTLADGDQLPARVIGVDTDTDVAVIKVNRTNLPAAVVGSVKNLRVGELAVAIGSPLGLEQTVTAGIISALGRSVDRQNEAPLVDMIQTDAPITQGNSGGALIDATGAVVGINAAIAASPEVGAEGIAFAIPIDVASAVAQELIKSGRATHPWLGVTGRTIAEEASEQFKVSEGAFIVSVTRGGPADNAGIRANDIVVSFDGEKIRSMDDLVVAIRSHDVGDRVTMVVSRDGRRVTVHAVLGDRPANVQ